MLSDTERVAIAVRRMDELMPAYHAGKLTFPELLWRVCGADKYLRKEVGRHFGARPKHRKTKVLEEKTTQLSLPFSSKEETTNGGNVLHTS